MQKLIGVASIFGDSNSYNDANFKKHSLVFDKIAVTGLNSARKAFEENLFPMPVDERLMHSSYLRNLEKTNLIIDSKDLHRIHIDDSWMNKDQHNQLKHFSKRLTELTERPDNANEALNLAVRMDAFALRVKMKDDIVVPMIDDFIGTSVQATKQSVYQLVIDKIPYPNENVSWDQITDFRNDEDSKRKFTALRVWISKISRSNLSINEAEEELNHLLNEYEHHFNIHKLKFERGTFQTIVMGVAEIAESLARLKFSKIAEIAFKLSNKQVDLLEGEAKLPGQEIAYLFKAKKQFNT